MRPTPEPRGPYSGHPYYCEVCGLGFPEYMACDLPDCRLESDEVAQSRAAVEEDGS